MKVCFCWCYAPFFSPTRQPCFALLSPTAEDSRCSLGPPLACTCLAAAPCSAFVPPNHMPSTLRQSVKPPHVVRAPYSAAAPIPALMPPEPPPPPRPPRVPCRCWPLWPKPPRPPPSHTCTPCTLRSESLEGSLDLYRGGGCQRPKKKFVDLKSASNVGPLSQNLIFFLRSI